MLAPIVVGIYVTVVMFARVRDLERTDSDHAGVCRSGYVQGNQNTTAVLSPPPGVTCGGHAEIA